MTDTPGGVLIRGKRATTLFAKPLITTEQSAAAVSTVVEGFQNLADYLRTCMTPSAADAAASMGRTIRASGVRAPDGLRCSSYGDRRRPGGA